MNYTIAAHPTEYKGILFRSRLEARWAAFFDLAKWEWKYEPIDFMGWSPDFFVIFSYEGKTYRKFAEVKPYMDIEQFNGHPCMSNIYMDTQITSAALGNDPSVSMLCVNYQGVNVVYVVDDCEALWNKAGEMVQYIPARGNIQKPVSADELMERTNKRRKQ